MLCHAQWLTGKLVARFKVLEEFSRAMGVLKQPALYGAFLAAVTSMKDDHPPARCDLLKHTSISPGS